MISLKELREKTAAFFKKSRDRYLNFKQALIRFITPIGAALIKAHKFITYSIVSATTFIVFISSKTWALYNQLHRKVYVWKILSVRKRWYVRKAGGFYNPKIKATIYPTWQCTWNISRFDDNYTGLDSKERAQDIAFKLWMKRRYFKNRLGVSDIQVTIPINLSQRILPNKIYIRKASPKDAPQLLNLMEQLGYPQGDEAMKDRIQAYAYSTNTHIFIAERGKQIVGFIAFIIYDLFASHGKRCHIEELLTRSQSSDLSIKRKLMEAVENFARENQGKIIDLTTGSYRANDATNDFYKFLGYDNDNVTTKRYLKKEL
jgi:ribosomal protein S18 acetylase RimI-like enzyme